MELPFNAYDWYWIVGGDESRAFSSAARAYVQADNSSFAAWRGSGGRPTKISTEAELWDVLAANAPTVAAQIPAALDRMKDRAVASLENGQMLGVLFKALRNINNRVLTLEGQPTLSVGQTRALLKQLLG